MVFEEKITRIGVGGCHQNKKDIFEYAYNNRDGKLLLDDGWGYAGRLVNTSFIGDFIKDKDRKDFIIIEKLPLFKGLYKEEFGKSLFEMNEDEIRKAITKVINTQLELTKAEYFDGYLLHAIYDDQYSSMPEMEDLEQYKKIVKVLLEFKEKGIIKHIGFSAHVGYLKLYHFVEEIERAFPGSLEIAEVAYNVLNDKGCTQKDLGYFQKTKGIVVWDAIGEKGIEYLKSRGFFIIDMMPHEGGRIGQVSTAPDWFRWADRFVCSNENIDVILEGTSFIPHYQMMLEEAGILEYKIPDMREISSSHKYCRE